MMELKHCLKFGESSKSIQTQYTNNNKQATKNITSIYCLNHKIKIRILWAPKHFSVWTGQFQNGQSINWKEN
jgi:hypothetical protein